MIDKYLNFKNELEDLKTTGSFRSLPALGKRNDKYVIFNQKSHLNLSSNDYLGLATDSDLHSKFYHSLDSQTITNEYGLSASSSRLLTGNIHLYQQLEDEITQLYKGENTLFFNSGYHANIGILPALTTKKDLIISDRLNHASIIDGIRLSDAHFERYKHLDYQHLEYILEKNKNHYEKIFIVSESIFSMDGDLADLQELITLKNKYNTFLYIDEAHAAGVLGEKGGGLAQQEQVVNEIDILVGTCGKALASTGAYALINNTLKEYLINKMRSVIFTTALPPINLNWNLFIFKHLPFLNDKRQHLKTISDLLRKELINKELETAGNSNIIPIMVGDNKVTIELSQHLQREGFLIFPIRPPTVPSNTARLRLSLTANMEWDDIKDLPELIQKFIRK